MGVFSLPKSARLHGKKQIDLLFATGTSLTFFPFRLVYLPLQNLESHRVLFSVSTRIFKRAVDRNTVKRRMREAFRLYKNEIQTSGKLVIAYIYIAKEILPLSVISEKMRLSFHRFPKI